MTPRSIAKKFLILELFYDPGQVIQMIIRPPHFLRYIYLYIIYSNPPSPPLGSYISIFTSSWRAVLYYVGGGKPFGFNLALLDFIFGAGGLVFQLGSWYKLPIMPAEVINNKLRR